MGKAFVGCQETLSCGRECAQTFLNKNDALTLVTSYNEVRDMN